MGMRCPSFLTPTLFFCCLASVCTRSFAQQANAADDTTPRIEINVNRVLVPVVVRDKQGHAVDGLKKEDFQVFDNDKPRAVSAFTLEQRGITEGTTAAGNTTTGAQSAVSSNVAQPGAQRFILFLFDDLHLSPEDLVRVRNAGAEALDGALATSDIGAVLSLSGNTNSGLTRDHARLHQAIMSLQTRNTFRPDPRACPNITYYQAVQIENEHSHDGPAFQDAFKQFIDCNPGIDPKYQQNMAENEVLNATNRSLNLGRQDAQMTYANLSAFVRTAATLPGQRMLIFISPGILPIEQESMTFESRMMDLAAQSNVPVSVLDARGLYTAELDASQHSPSLIGGSVQQQSDYRRTSMLVAENAMGALADGTGGTFFHNSNDLGAGFKALTEAPETLYVLELSLDNVKPDGKYHRLNVKVDRDGVEVHARHGYSMPKPEKNKK
jgi:VWFA-related protein